MLTLPTLRGLKFRKGEMMNKQVIKLAHVVVVGILLLIGGIVVAQQQSNTNQQNSNQQESNANSKSSRNKNANPNASGSMNSNAGQNMNANMSLTSSDQKFALEAAMGGMAEVEMGRLAVQHGSSAAVKQFGQRMVDDHSQANSELMQLASTKGITLPTGLDAKHQSEIAKMSQLSGAAFDRAYSKEMVKDHEKDVALFQKQSMRGADSDLKSLAAKTLPTLQEHLQMARALSANRSGAMNGNMNNGNSNNSNRR
jgi:putative membrane protein